MPENKVKIPILPLASFCVYKDALTTITSIPHKIARKMYNLYVSLIVSTLFITSHENTQ